MMLCFFNQMCVNHFSSQQYSKNMSLDLATLTSVNCRIAFLNKEYTHLDNKIEYIQSLSATLVLTHHHTVAELKDKLKGVSVARIPFATYSVYSKFGKQSVYALPYKRDVGHSGNSQYYSNNTDSVSHNITTLSWRQTFHQLEVTGKFREVGVNVTIVPFAKSVDTYIRNIAESKIWFSTLSQGDLLPVRTFDVLASGRAMLLMNRPQDRRITDGILYEGVHCAMFNTSEEMLEKVKYYIDHENERHKIVMNAYNLATSSHYWKNRASTIKFLIDDMNCGI